MVLGFQTMKTTTTENKYPFDARRNIKTLVEDFIEKDRKGILEKYLSDKVAAAELYWKLHGVLMRNTLAVNEPDAEDLEDMDLGKVLVEWHLILLPVWRKFKKALFDFKENVPPERETHESMVGAVEDPSSPMHEYQDLMVTSYFSPERFYDLKVRGTAYTVTLSFESEKVGFLRRDLNIVDGFLDTLRDAPIDLFSRCRHCKKVIVITREGKAYCKGCASKAKQKELWEKDPKGCRERERIRYKQKRRRTRE
jgi:hypothetical protein